MQHQKKNGLSISEILRLANKWVNIFYGGSPSKNLHKIQLLMITYKSEDGSSRTWNFMGYHHNVVLKWDKIILSIIDNNVSDSESKHLDLDYKINVKLTIQNKSLNNFFKLLNYRFSCNWFLFPPSFVFAAYEFN